MAGLRSYEDVNGPVPRAAAFDSDGLAQQTSGPPMPMLEQRMVDLDRAQQRMVSSFEVPPEIDFDDAMMMSNVGPDVLLASPGFAAAAAQGAASRLAAGFAADGSVGGPFSQTSPPPGLQFGGYLKGCTGVVWEPVAAAAASTSALNRVFFEILPSGDVDALRSQLESRALGVNERIGKGPTALRTLLHWAVSRGQRPLIELLVVEFGADTTLTDGQGKTPAELCGGEWSEFIAEMLSKA